MKRLSYQESIHVDYERLFIFLGELMQGCANQNLLKSFYVCDHLERLQATISSSQGLSHYLFKKLKKCCDQADNYVELEKYVVYMNLLFDEYYEPFVAYKRNLLKVILDYTTDYFTSDEYCVIRHLVDKRNTIDDIISLGKHNIRHQDFLTFYFDCEIYLLEGDFKEATKLLQMIPMEGALVDYQEELETYLKNENRKQWVLSFLHKKPLSLSQTYSLLR